MGLCVKKKKGVSFHSAWSARNVWGAVWRVVAWVGRVHGAKARRQRGGGKEATRATEQSIVKTKQTPTPAAAPVGAGLPDAPRKGTKRMWAKATTRQGEQTGTKDTPATRPSPRRRKKGRGHAFKHKKQQPAARLGEKRASRGRVQVALAAGADQDSSSTLPFHPLPPTRLPHAQAPPRAQLRHPNTSPRHVRLSGRPRGPCRVKGGDVKIHYASGAKASRCELEEMIYLECACCSPACGFLLLCVEFSSFFFFFSSCGGLLCGGHHPSPHPPLRAASSPPAPHMLGVWRVPCPPPPPPLPHKNLCALLEYYTSRIRLVKGGAVHTQPPTPHPHTPPHTPDTVCACRACRAPPAPQCCPPVLGLKATIIPSARSLPPHPHQPPPPGTHHHDLGAQPHDPLLTPRPRPPPTHTETSLYPHPNPSF